MNNFLKSILPYNILVYLNKLIRDKRKYTFIQNINWEPNNQAQKRVLISYVFDHLFDSIENSQMNTRGVECAIIINEFLNKGYSIDMIDCQDNSNVKFLKNKEYDLIFGFGHPFNFVAKNGNSLKRVIYLTEKHPTFSLKKEKERIKYYMERHHKKVHLSRSNLYFREEDFNDIDSIVYIGNPFEASLIPLDVPKYPIKPTGLINPIYKHGQRTISESKKNFLWFGSIGAIHKGLDLLIDVFKDKISYNLYIAGLRQLDKKLLPKFQSSVNIFDIGFVNVQSEEFLNLVYKCSFVVLPSCSEAYNTGVITCMNHGLIPIVTKETGFEVSDFGIVLDDFKISTIAQALTEASDQKEEIIKEQHMQVYDYSIENFSLSNFQDTFASTLNSL